MKKALQGHRDSEGVRKSSLEKVTFERCRNLKMWRRGKEERW
jgi:hypothetical protein